MPTCQRRFTVKTGRIVQIPARDENDSAALVFSDRLILHSSRQSSCSIGARESRKPFLHRPNLSETAIGAVRSSLQIDG